MAGAPRPRDLLHAKSVPGSFAWGSRTSCRPLCHPPAWVTWAGLLAREPPCRARNPSWCRPPALEKARVKQPWFAGQRPARTLERPSPPNSAASTLEASPQGRRGQRRWDATNHPQTRTAGLSRPGNSWPSLARMPHMPIVNAAHAGVPRRYPSNASGPRASPITPALGTSPVARAAGGKPGARARSGGDVAHHPQAPTDGALIAGHLWVADRPCVRRAALAGTEMYLRNRARLSGSSAA